MRIVLLGKNELDNARVGNLILGRDAFLTEALEVSGENQSERIRGLVEGRPITVINTPDLFHPQLTPDEIKTAVNECMSLSAPGPHAFLLVLQSDSFSEEDRNRVKDILNWFSDKATNYTIALAIVRSARHLSPSDADKEETPFRLIMKDCKMRYHMFDKIYRFDQNQVIQLLEKIDKMVEENGGSCLTNEIESTLTLEKIKKREGESDTNQGEGKTKKNKEGKTTHDIFFFQVFLLEIACLPL